MPERKSFRIVTAVPTVVAIVVLILCSCSLITWNWKDRLFETGSRGVWADRESGKQFAGRVRMPPIGAETHYLLGVYHQRAGRHVEAIARFNKALVQMPDSVKALNGLGISYDRLGDHLSAVRSFRRALAIHPNLDYVLNNLCYSQAMWGDAESAVSACRLALSQNGGNSRIRNNLALACAMAGHYDQAFGELLSAAGGNRLSAHSKMAAIYFEKAMFGKASHHYRQALLIDPSSDAARKGLAASEELIRIAGPADRQSKTEIAAGRKEKLENPPEPQAVSASPAQDIAGTADYLDRARTHYEKGEFEQAQVQYRLVVSLDPAHEEARRGLMASEALARIVAPSPAERMPHENATVVVDKLLFDAGTAKGGIEICNGNGRRYMARDVAGYLKNRGFKVVRITNARSFRHAGGVIYYTQDHLTTARSLASQIEPMADLQQVNRLGSRRVNVKVLLGKDIIAYRTIYGN